MAEKNTSWSSSAHTAAKISNILVLSCVTLRSLFSVATRGNVRSTNLFCGKHHCKLVLMA